MEIELVPTASDIMEKTIDSINIINEITADMDTDEQGLKLEVKMEGSCTSPHRPISENNSIENWNTHSGQLCLEPNDFFEVKEIKLLNSDSTIDFSIGSERKKHISNLEENSNIRKCEENYPFNYSNLKKFVKFNSKQPNDIHFKCTFCPIVFSKKEALKLHFMIDHPDQNINTKTLFHKTTKCLICDKICKTETSLKCHLKVHLGKEPYACPICSKICLTKQKLKSHLNVHHDCENFIRCQICFLKCKSKGQKEAHYRKHHSTIVPSSIRQKPYIHSPDNNYVAKCKFCRHICYSPTILKKHILTHVVPPFVCKICSREFNVKTAFARHINFEQRKDSDDIVKKCEFCFQNFFTTSSLSHHINIFHKNEKLVNRTDPNIRKNNIEDPKNEKIGNTKDLKCDSCSERFVTETTLRRHVMNSHRTDTNIREKNIENPTSSTDNGKDLKFDDKKSREKTYKCKHCTKICVSKSSYQTHIKCHIFVKCKLCESKIGINSIKTMEAHVDTHIKDEKPFTCQICSRQFGYRRDLKTHLVAETKEIKESFYKCDICHLHYYFKTFLSKHLIYKHRPYVIDLSIKEKESYNCQKCEREFKDESKLQRHLATHEYSETCLVCKVTFDNPTEFRSHFGEHADNSGYQCPMCSMKFSLKDKLKRHMISEQRKLTKPPLFTCSICNKGFQTESPLRNHKRMFHAKRPLTEDEAAFKCFYCGKLFIQVGSYQSHMRRHNFLGHCKICLASFTCRSRMFKHLDEHVGQKPFTCVVCNRIFTSKASLRDHLKYEQLKNSHKMVLKCEICGYHYFHKMSFNKHVSEHRFDIQEVIVEPEVMAKPEDTKNFDEQIKTEPADLDIKEEILDVPIEEISNVSTKGISDVLTKEEMQIIPIKEEMLEINIKVEKDEYVMN